MKYILMPIVTIAFGLLTTLHVQGQNDCSKRYLEKLPSDLKLENGVPQKYLMTTDYFDYDLFGNFIKKMRITGEYTRGLENGYAKWNNVRIANSQNLNEAFPEGEKKSVMENFTYLPSGDITDESFFKDIPQADILLKNLVWDMVGLESFAWLNWDQLKLNQEFSARDVNFEFDLAGEGTFENKDIRLKWIGITQINNEICAIIKYIALNNPFTVDNPQVTVKGRTHYWGNIYVSLEDKQIEYTELHEDMVMDVKIPGQEQSNQVNTVRYIYLERIN